MTARAEAIVAVDGLDKTFALHLRGGVEIGVLRRVSMTLAPGECVALRGPSGIGKSTPLRCIYGNYRPLHGVIRVRDGADWVDIAAAHPRRIPLASHDDATEAHVEEAASLGLSISEFPTTEAAARAARAAGLRTTMGAPNLIRSRSHSGNISAACVARAGLLDALSSNYAPISLLHGAILLHRQLDLPLAQAFGRVTRGPAGMVGLDDRGEIACGKAADLVAFDLKQEVPVVRHV